MKNWFKENQNHLIIIGIFLLLVVFYFAPVWQGKTLLQSDVMQARGSQKEIMDFKEKDGHAPLWTNSMFGGMPTYQIWYDHASNIGSYIGPGIRSIFPTPSDALLLFLLGGYFLLSVLRIRPWLAAVGAVALAFTSYNFVYIEAGHVSKAYAIAYMAPIIGAVILCYRGSKFWGPSLLALFLALEIRANHIQVTYYLFITLLILVGFELYYAIRDKKLKKFFQATGLQLIGVILAVLVNASVLFPTYEYSKLTIRGKSNITKVEDGKTTDSHGLDKEYAYAWSQGIGETITFLIPDAYGGKSGGLLGPESNVVKTMTKMGVSEREAMQFANRATPTYWGEKSFTQGPWYFGAGIIFLFILALFVVKDRLKWWIVSAIVLTLLLSFGKNFPLVSNLFFDYFPMYNKFRAVESILVIPAVLIPLLAIMGLNEIITRGNEIPKLDKKVLYSGIGVAAICLIVALMPSVLDLRTSQHQEYVGYLQQNIGDQNFTTQIVNALLQDRADMASKDAWRSFFIVVITMGAVWFYIKKKVNLAIMIGILAVVTLADLWSLDKRYLNNESFVDKSIYEKPIPEREVDQLIHMDKDLSYRVFDLTTNPFSDASASYFHKSIGGYHAAKLMRYQELLERQFTSNGFNEDVLDMLNVRYVITKDEKTNSDRIQRRSTALGNAWFVNNVKFVNGANAEMDAISNFDPKKEAIVNEGLKDLFGDKSIGQPTNADIKLVSYHPDTMRYEYTAANQVFAVFSEIFYDKGWKAYVDGEEVPIIRADYLLRGLSLPGGNHKVEFIFAPQSMKISNIVSMIGSLVLILGIAVAIWFSLKNRKTHQKPAEVKK